MCQLTPHPLDHITSHCQNMTGIQCQCFTAWSFTDKVIRRYCLFHKIIRIEQMYCKGSIIHIAAGFEPHAFRFLALTTIKAHMAVWATSTWINPDVFFQKNKTSSLKAEDAGNWDSVAMLALFCQMTIKDFISKDDPSYDATSPTQESLQCAGKGFSCVHAALYTKKSWLPLPPPALPEPLQGTGTFTPSQWAHIHMLLSLSPSKRDHNKLWWIEDGSRGT